MMRIMTDALRVFATCYSVLYSMLLDGCKPPPYVENATATFSQVSRTVSAVVVVVVVVVVLMVAQRSVKSVVLCH